ncbi:MAG: DUF6017 domain-containing protein, partial [Oliverpabstia sp.]
FIRIPRMLLTEETFSSLTLQSKMLYSVLLDRMSLSMKNGWFDEENRVYIIYQISEIQSDLGFSKRKAMDYLAELETFGLVQKKKRGFGLPSIIYVKSFLIQKDYSRSIETGTSMGKQILSRSTDFRTSDAIKCTSRGSGSGTSEVIKLTPLEVQESAPLNNKTNTNHIYQSDIKSNHILSADADEMRCDPADIIKAYEKIIKDNIEYDALLQANRFDEELVQGIFELILETVVSQSETILIASEKYPAALVKSKFLKLNYMHIDYVISCMKKNTTRVKNIKKYLLATLFNAPTTMEGYYRAEVNADMPQFAG